MDKVCLYYIISCILFAEEAITVLKRAVISLYQQTETVCAATKTDKYTQ